MSNSSSAIIQDIAEKLRLISANSKFMQPKCIKLEMTNLSSFVQQIATKFSIGETDYHKDNFSGELADISYEIDRVFQFISNARDVHKVPSELKAIRIKLEKISKNLRSNINYAKEENTTKMSLKYSNRNTDHFRQKGGQRKHYQFAATTRAMHSAHHPQDHKYKPNSTEFARDIFEDKRVSNHFSRTVWVDAPRLIDVKKLKNIAKRRPSTLLWVIQTLNKDLEGKKVLLVLDDIKKELELGTMYITHHARSLDKVFISTSETENSNCSIWTANGLGKLSVEEAWKMIKREKVIENMELYEGSGKEILSKMERWDR